MYGCGGAAVGRGGALVVLPACHVGMVVSGLLSVVGRVLFACLLSVVGRGEMACYTSLRCCCGAVVGCGALSLSVVRVSYL